jgi:hypothetical protein
VATWFILPDNDTTQGLIRLWQILKASYKCSELSLKSFKSLLQVFYKPLTSLIHTTFIGHGFMGSLVHGIMGSWVNGSWVIGEGSCGRGHGLWGRGHRSSIIG